MNIKRLILALLFSFVLVIGFTSCAKEPVYEPCKFCNGTGVCPMCHGEKESCEYCSGSGKCSACNGTGHNLTRKWCPKCGAELKYWDTKCPKCGIKVKYDGADKDKDL